MLPLRYARSWRVISALLLIFALVAAVTPVFWFIDSRATALSWVSNVDKWLHAVAFFTLAVWFAGLMAKRSYWLIAAGLMMFGFLVEFVQLQTSYRTADWGDIAANTVGIILGLTVAAAGLGGWGLRFEDWYSRRV